MNAVKVRMVITMIVTMVKMITMMVKESNDEKEAASWLQMSQACEWQMQSTKQKRAVTLIVEAQLS